MSDEDDVMGDPTIGQVGCEVAGVDKGADAEANVNQPVGENEISEEEKLKYLAQARVALEQSGKLCVVWRRSFYNYQRTFRFKKVSKLKQTSISDHLFTKKNCCVSFPSR